MGGMGGKCKGHKKTSLRLVFHRTVANLQGWHIAITSWVQF
jgi:hypothetical protein